MKKIITLLVFLIVLGVNAANAENVNAKLQELQQALALNPNDAANLDRLAEHYHAQDNVALQQLQQALALNPNDVANLESLAELYDTQSKYTEAEPLYQRSLAIREKSLGKNHLEVAKSLNNLAWLYKNQKKYTEAESLFQRSLAIREKALSKNHVDVAVSLNNLAGLYKTQGKYDQAEPLFLRSLAIFEKTEESSDFDFVSKKLADLYKIQGNYAKVELLLQRSLAIKEKTLSKDHPDFAIALNKLALFYDNEGKYTDAEPLYKRSLAILEKALGQDDPKVAQSLNNLAALYFAQGKYEQAEPFFIKSLAIREKVLRPDDIDIAQSLDNLAVLYRIQGKYADAESFHNRCRTIREKSLGKDDPKVAIVLNNLGLLYYAQEKYAEAEPLYKKSLEIREKAGKNNPDVATSLHNLAALYDAQGKYEQAEPLYQQALEIDEKSLGKNHPNIAIDSNNLAFLYKTQSKYEQAERYYLRSLAIWKKSLGKDHSSVADSLNNLAWLYIAQGKYEQAQPLLQNSLQIIDKSLSRWLWGADEKTRQSYLQQEESRRNSYLSFYSFYNTPEEAFYFSLARKGWLLRISSEVSTLAKQSPDPAIQKQKQAFNALRIEISNLFISGKADNQNLEKKSNDLERQLSQQLSSFKSSKTEVTPKQVLAKLSSEKILIDFLIYKEVDFKTKKGKTEQVIALIVDKKNGIKLIKFGELEPIAKLIENYHYFPTAAEMKPIEDEIKIKNLSNEEAKRKREDYIKNFLEEKKTTLPKVAEQLYTLLWQPLTPYLQNKKTVYLIPDGDLHLLPFKALQDTDGKYLTEKWQLITLSSARDIVLPPLEGKASAAAIFAAPDYGDDTAIIKTGNTAGATELKNIHFAPLPRALKEGQKINDLFKEKQPKLSLPEPFIQEKATEQAINALIAPKILHLATHGFFLEDIKPNEKSLEHGFMRGLDEPVAVGKIENPLTRSGLAFVGANLGVKGIIKQAENTDGILTALEVLNLDLAGTDLVTLSACDTGKGDVKIGEGVYSLNRAFQEAGAKAVLSTLWSVDDQATSEFMQKFYTRFLDGKPAQIAIQETQQEFMQDKKYSNPYYWAGFVMIGKN